jgi:photosystem II stability/assembly factor-like uncharacterized protein
MTGLAVGSAGTVLRTVDGGITWSVESSGVDTDLRAVWITSGGTAVAVGMSATVIHSTNGGMTWSPADIPAFLDTEHMNGVSMWDDQRGVAVGYGELGGDGTILVTDDGGATWTARNREIDDGGFSAFFAVWAEGDSLACIGAREGRVVRSDDGGETWITLDSGSIWAVESMHFVDETHGWACTHQRDILRTSDGGLTWDVITGPQNHIDDIQFGSADVGIAVGTTGSVLGSTDGGETWMLQHAGLTTWSHARAVWMTSPTDAVVVGTETDILYTRSAGWTP